MAKWFPIQPTMTSSIRRCSWAKIRTKTHTSSNQQLYDQNVGGAYEFHAGDVIDLIFNAEHQVLKNKTYWGILLTNPNSSPRDLIWSPHPLHLQRHQCIGWTRKIFNLCSSSEYTNQQKQNFLHVNFLFLMPVWMRLRRRTKRHLVTLDVRSAKTVLLVHEMNMGG